MVSARLASEMKELCDECLIENVYFDLDSGRELSIFLRVFGFLQDRPERCHWLRLAHGGGRYAGRFGWVADLSKLDQLIFLPSCSGCRELRMRTVGPFQAHACRLCADWDFSNVFFPVPKDYPTVFQDGNDVDLPESAPVDPKVCGTHLPCRRIEVEELKSACSSAFDMIRCGKWAKKEAHVYLETHGISKEFCNEVCESATVPGGSPPKIPASWNIPGVDVRHHIDVPMHLCFLGIAKSNFSELISGWLKSRRQATSFLATSAPFLRSVQKLSLSWCPVEVKFGAYVSEHWVSYCRLSKRIYQPLEHLERTDEEYSDPAGLELQQYHWKQKKAWLLAREVEGIEKKSLKSVIETKFEEFLSLPEEELPTIVRPVVSQARLEDVNNLITSWHACISRLMSLNKNPSEFQVGDIERHIKLFLTFVEEFDKSRRRTQCEQDQTAPPKKKRKKETVVQPVWRRKPNYLGLLNYPDTVQLMGPLRMLTELDLKGESHIKHIKNKIQGMHGNWAYNAMLKYYQERSFQFVMKDSVHDLDKEGNSKESMVEIARRLAGSALGSGKRRRGTNYKIYRTKADAIGSLLAAIPIAGVIVEERFYLVLRDETMLEIKPRQWKKQVCGADYFLWEHVEDLAPIQESSEYFLLLPDGLVNTEGAFYLVSSEWRELVRVNRNGFNFVLELPRIPGASY